jgi:NTE family protein
MMRHWVFLLGLALAACGSPPIDYRGKDAAHFEQPQRNSLGRPLIAVALGSGGPRGLTHVGVLKALEENGIVPDLIVGTSSGAIVGALYASGMPLAEMETMAMDLQPMEILDFSYSDRGWIRGEALQNFINRLVKQRRLEQLPKEAAIVSTDLKTGRAVVFNRGDTGLAVRASSAIPGRFQPVKINGKFYLDGDLVSPVPMRVARELGADVVIGVDVSAFIEDTPTEKSFPTEWITTGTMRKTIVDHEARYADVIIHPNIGYYAGWSDGYKHNCFTVGERAALAAIPKIKAAIAAAQERISAQ